MRKSPSVALATWEKLPELSEDDRTLLPELAKLGITPAAAVWSDPSVRWARFDAVVLRSTWEYYRHLEEFLAWVDRVGAVTTLWNPPGLVRWNSHKSYLLVLESRGVPIVPTRISPNLREAARAARRQHWDRVVLKPAVSAGAYRTFLVDAGSLEEGSGSWTDLAGAGEILVQPYQGEVERTGERSLVFFQGTYSHAFLRAPHLIRTSDLVEGTPVLPSGAELEVASRALAAAPGRTLYGRVDLVSDGEVGPRVMELEVIEPFLGLATSLTAARTFANAIASTL